MSADISRLSHCFKSLKQLRGCMRPHFFSKGEGITADRYIPAMETVVIAWMIQQNSAPAYNVTKAQARLHSTGLQMCDHRLFQAAIPVTTTSGA